jgi:signal transduction histidine kinase
VTQFEAAIAESDALRAGIDDPEVVRKMVEILLPLPPRFAQLASSIFANDVVRSSDQWAALDRLKHQFWAVLGLFAATGLLLAWMTFRQQRRIGQANDQLRLLAERSADDAAEFQDAITSLADGLILWDAQDRVSTWNRRCEEILPDARDVLRRGLPFSTYVESSSELNHPQWPETACAQRVAERTAQHRRRSGTGEFTTADGRIIEVRENPTSSGGCISVFRDITAERRLLARLMRNEAELQRALAAEREINAQQRQFVSMASHEFRTPLAIIDSASQRLLAASAAGPELSTRIERIRSSVARMVQIIDRTLSTAQLDEGRVELQPTDCDLRTILNEVCERQKGIAQRVTIRLDLPDDDLSLTADPRLLDQIFTNLVANAVKYSGPSTTVEVRATAGQDHVSVHVRDHGLGIPQDEIDRLFTRFYRASTTLTIPGTGIGLHLVKQFLALHGGSVEVTSEVRKGSTFTVHLPRTQPAAAQERAVA